MTAWTWAAGPATPILQPSTGLPSPRDSARPSSLSTARAPSSMTGRSLPRRNGSDRRDGRGRLRAGVAGAWARDPAGPAGAPDPDPAAAEERAVPAGGRAADSETGPAVSGPAWAARPARARVP